MKCGIETGVPQGSIFGLLFFNIYICDLLKFFIRDNSANFTDTTPYPNLSVYSNSPAKKPQTLCWSLLWSFIMTYLQPRIQTTSFQKNCISIFQKHFFGYRTDTDFSGAPMFCYRTDNDFPESLFRISTNRYRFSKEDLYSYRTDNDFPGSLFRILTNRQEAIPRKVPPSEQIFQHQVSVDAFKHCIFSL